MVKVVKHVAEHCTLVHLGILELTLALWMKISTAFESTASAFSKQVFVFSNSPPPAKMPARRTRADTHICKINYYARNSTSQAWHPGDKGGHGPTFYDWSHPLRAVALQKR